MAKETNVVAVTSSLATKHRPKTLKDLIGQESVKAQMAGFIKTKSFPDSILITGNSGTGKTSVAKLIARYVNCDTLNACGKCKSCLLVNHPDVMEVNVGDTRGIDDIRAIIQSATSMPRYKKRVILLDECHQLTKQAASALLIPIEHPSKNTIFILATTNPEKLLPTIIGRCTRLELRPLSEDHIVQRLYTVGKREGLNFQELEKGVEALEFIASVSLGQMRDAIQMLGSVMAVINSGTKMDALEIVTEFIGSQESDIETSAGNLLFTTLNGNRRGMLREILRAENVRLLLSKTRWLCMTLLDVYAFQKEWDRLKANGRRRWQSIAEQVFNKQVEKNKYDLRPDELILLIRALEEAEFKMNEISIDEKVLLVGALGDYIGRL